MNRRQEAVWKASTQNLCPLKAPTSTWRYLGGWSTAEEHQQMCPPQACLFEGTKWLLLLHLADPCRGARAIACFFKIQLKNIYIK